MARYSVDDPDMQAYARWLLPRMTRKELDMARVMRAAFKRYTPDCFEAPVRNHARDYARQTEGAVLLTRREHFQAAQGTVCAMFERGDLTAPDGLPQAFQD